MLAGDTRCTHQVDSANHRNGQRQVTDSHRMYRDHAIHDITVLSVIVIEFTGFALGFSSVVLYVEVCVDIHTLSHPQGRQRIVRLRVREEEGKEEEEEACGVDGALLDSLCKRRANGYTY